METAQCSDVAEDLGGRRDGDVQASGQISVDSQAATDVLTVDELARMLRVNRKTAYAAINRGEIPGVRRLGGAIRISRSAVVEWLSRGEGRTSKTRRAR